METECWTFCTFHYGVVKEKLSEKRWNLYKIGSILAIIFIVNLILLIVSALGANGYIYMSQTIAQIMLALTWLIFAACVMGFVFIIVAPAVIKPQSQYYHIIHQQSDLERIVQNTNPYRDSPSGNAPLDEDGVEQFRIIPT
jgi:predicted membrane protein